MAGQPSLTRRDMFSFAFPALKDRAKVMPPLRVEIKQLRENEIHNEPKMKSDAGSAWDATLLRCQ
jgi:hypothetical protein